MAVGRIVFFILLLLGISSVVGILIIEKPQPPFARTFSPLFQELGKPIKSIDRTISHIYPVNEIDEKMLGDEIKARLTEKASVHTPHEEAIVRYLNALVAFSTQDSSKPFKYEVFLVEGPPNAFACPGGVICVTKELIDILDDEAELMAILGHEIGHIERGHLFDAARGVMLRKKIQEASVVSYAFEVVQMLASFTFNKTQEDEADEYGFRLLLNQGYDPFAMSTSFEKILNTSHDHVHANPLNDFFSTHPYTELRIEKFRSRAELWKARNTHRSSYRGKKNLAERIAKFEKTYSKE